MTATERPQVLPVDAEGIPPDLKARPQWVLWRLVTRDGKPTKLPYQTSGAMAKSDDSSTWTTFEAALAAYQRGGYSGIGYVFSPDDPYVGIDLDDCIDVDTGAPSAWAVEITKRLGTYAETSPSGTGIKLWARGTLPTEATGRKRPYESGAVEMYQRGRYFAVTGQQLRHWTAPIGDAQDGIDWLWAEALADKHHERNGHHRAAQDDDLRHVIERARKYLAAMPYADGTGGHNGSDQTFDAACALVLGFALTPEQAYPLMVEYSDRCVPPWSEKEIWHKLRDADKKPQERGYLRDARRNDDRPKSGNASQSSAPPAEKRIEYQLVSCRELDAAEYDLEYLIDHMLVARQPCIFAGGKKCLKTSLLIDLAIALAMGGSFLGRFSVRRAVRVLMMTGESGMATVQETTRRIAAAQGYSLADIGGLIFSPQLPLFGHLLHMDAIAETLQGNEIETLIIDPAYLAMPTDGNEASLFAMGALLRGMADVCQKIGVTFILAHHTRKTLADPFAPPELEDIAWAGFNEFARQWVLLGRRERYEPGTGNHRLWLNAGGSAGHSSCWALDVAEGVYDGRTPRQWQISLMLAEDARRDAEQRQHGAKEQKRKATSAAHLEGDRKAIVAAAVKFKGEAFTFTKLREHAGIKPERFGIAFSSLADDGVFIDAEVIAKNKQKYDGYKLKESTE